MPDAIPEHPAEESRVAPPSAVDESAGKQTPAFASEPPAPASPRAAPEAQADEAVETEEPESVPELAGSTEAGLDKPAPVRPTYTVWSSGPSSGTHEFGPKDE
jgi:hypothetical protein